MPYREKINPFLRPDPEEEQEFLAKVDGTLLEHPAIKEWLERVEDRRAQQDALWELFNEEGMDPDKRAALEEKYYDMLHDDEHQANSPKDWTNESLKEFIRQYEKNKRNARVRRILAKLSLRS